MTIRFTGYGVLNPPQVINFQYNDLNKPVKGEYSNPVTQQKISYSYFYQ